MQRAHLRNAHALPALVFRHAPSGHALHGFAVHYQRRAEEKGVDHPLAVYRAVLAARLSLENHMEVAVLVNQQQVAVAVQDVQVFHALADNIALARIAVVIPVDGHHGIDPLGHGRAPGDAV